MNPTDDTTLEKLVKPAFLIIDLQVRHNNGIWHCDNGSHYDCIERIVYIAEVALDNGYPVIASEYWSNGDKPISSVKLIPQLDELQGIYVLRKPSISAFKDTNLKEYLISKDVDSVIIVGYHRDICVIKTIEDAYNLEFVVVSCEPLTFTSNPSSTRRKTTLEKLNEYSHHCKKYTQIMALFSD
ncbi:isochorismatase family protein [Candidatus Woesearchaeota archaeon]|nr:isochorismatase family protein [Candidatus Woesearchaeota archaeon]